MGLRRQPTIAGQDSSIGVALLPRIDENADVLDPINGWDQDSPGFGDRSDRMAAIVQRPFADQVEVLLLGVVLPIDPL